MAGFDIGLVQEIDCQLDALRPLVRNQAISLGISLLVFVDFDFLLTGFEVQPDDPSLAEELIHLLLFNIIREAPDIDICVDLWPVPLLFLFGLVLLGLFSTDLELHNLILGHGGIIHNFLLFLFFLLLLIELLLLGPELLLVHLSDCLIDDLLHVLFQIGLCFELDFDRLGGGRFGLWFSNLFYGFYGIFRI